MLGRDLPAPLGSAEVLIRFMVRSQSQNDQRCVSPFALPFYFAEKAARGGQPPSTALAKTEGNASFMTSRLNTTIQLTMLARAPSDEENSGVNKNYFDNNKGGRDLVQHAGLVFEQNLSTSHRVEAASVLTSSRRLSREATFLLASSLVRFTFPSRPVTVPRSGHFGEKVGQKVRRLVSYA